MSSTWKRLIIRPSNGLISSVHQTKDSAWFAANNDDVGLGDVRYIVASYTSSHNPLTMLSTTIHYLFFLFKVSYRKKRMLKPCNDIIEQLKGCHLVLLHWANFDEIYILTRCNDLLIYHKAIMIADCVHWQR